MRPGDPRDMLEVAPHDVRPAMARVAAYGRGYRTAQRDGRRRTAARLLAAFALGLAAGLLISDVRAVPRPASQLGIPVSAEGRTGAPQTLPFVPASLAASASRAPARRAAAPTLVHSGIASNMGPRFPATYLALPDGPGFTVRICGPADCVVRISTDAGPSRAMQRAGRVADLSVADFERVSGQPWRRGLTSVTLTVLRVPR